MNFRISPFRVALHSYTLSCPSLYWNQFYSPITLGFRSGFVINSPLVTNYYFSKASYIILKIFQKFYSRAFLFGFFDDYKTKPSLLKRDATSFNPYFRIFINSYNVIVRGFFWRGGALTNFKRFKVDSTYFFYNFSNLKHYKYHPTLAMSTHYTSSTLSLGFESLAARVPLVTPIDGSIDPSIFSYPIPMNSATSNIFFFSNFYFSKFFKSFCSRFLVFKKREQKFKKVNIILNTKKREQKDLKFKNVRVLRRLPDEIALRLKNLNFF
jgi:hypothetical protein